MFIRNFSRKIAPGVRRIHTTGVVRSGHDTRGIYGSNLPFNVNNHASLLFWFSLYFGSGLALPFLAVRQMILSKNG